MEKLYKRYTNEALEDELARLAGLIEEGNLSKKDAKRVKIVLEAIKLEMEIKETTGDE